MKPKCRCCLSAKGSVKLSNIFKAQNANEDETLRSIFEKCSRFSVAPDEPQLLCKPCLDLMMSAYQFYKLTQATQRSLTGLAQEVVIVKTEYELTETENQYHSYDLDDKKEALENKKVESEDEQMEFKDDNFWGDEATDHEDENQVGAQAGASTDTKDSKINVKLEEIPEDEFKKPTEKRYRCPYCPDNIEPEHKLEKKRGRPKTATEYLRRDFARHFEQHHPGIQKIACSWCSKRYWIQELLDYHLTKCVKRPDRNPLGEQVVCPYCAKLVYSKSIKAHLVSHGQPTIYHCDLCSTQYTSKPGISSHMKNKHIGVRFQCEHCSQSYPSRDLVKNHVFRDHKLGPKLQCELCQYSTYIPKDLKRHIKRHSEIGNFSCQICGYRTYDGDKLKAHMTSHSDEKNYSCSECGARYKNRSSLTQHSYVHQGIIYSCPVCSTTFKSRRSHREHIKRKHPGHPIPYTTDKPNIINGSKLGLQPVESSDITPIPLWDQRKTEVLYKMETALS